MAVLLGRQSAGTTGDFIGAGDTAVWKFVASASGQLAVIFAQTKVANATATAIRLGIYADNGAGTHPSGAALGVATVDVLADARGTGVFKATLGAPVTIVSGTTYWLGWHASTENFDFQGDVSAGTYVESGIGDFPTWSGDSAGNTTAIIWGESVDVVSGGPVPARPLLMKMVPLSWQRLWLPIAPLPASAAATIAYNDSGSGTITLSGSGTESYSHSGSASGTITLSGTATRSYTHSASGAGTITLSGTKVESLVYTDARAGTITISGSRTENETHTASGAGTITLSGTGFDEYIPPAGGGGAGLIYDQTPFFLISH